MSNMEETGNKEWGPSIRAHWTALELLRDAVSQAHHDWAEFKSSIEEKVSMEVRAHLSILNWMIQDHGSIGDTMAKAVASGKALQKKIQEISNEMIIFCDELTSYAKAAKVSKTNLLGIISKVLDISWEGSRKADAHLEQVKLVLNQGWWRMRGQAPSAAAVVSPGVAPSQGIVLTSSMRKNAINADTPLGSIHIGGSDTPLTMKTLFLMVCDLQAKVDLLTKRSKNTGVIFNRHAFASKLEFTVWYMGKNSSGDGLAAFVDVISIWSFGTTDQINSLQWLHKKHCSKAIGLNGRSYDMGYAFSMTSRYPTLFVRSNKKNITSTTTIKMLESFDAWRGNNIGNSTKERLEDTLQIAIKRHQQYCNNHLTNGELKTMALKTVDTTRIFWAALVAYINDEYAMLCLFNLLTKHIMLLLSNQVVQICNNVFEVRGNAGSVDLKNKGVTGARFAWVTLQALNCMAGYCWDKFKYHQAINGTFVRFLTRHMAGESSMGLKATFDKLEAKVKALEANSKNKVSQEVFNRLDSKLTNILHLNQNIKQSA
jgi:hypothetical protein